MLITYIYEFVCVYVRTSENKTKGIIKVALNTLQNFQVKANKIWVINSDNMLKFIVSGTYRACAQQCSQDNTNQWGECRYSLGKLREILICQYCQSQFNKSI